MRLGGPPECQTLKSRLPVYIYTHTQTHTSDRLIFKIPFDSENLGKFMRFDGELFLISAF